MSRTRIQPSAPGGLERELGESIAAVLRKSKGPDRNGWWTACCPFHQDSDPSLRFTNQGFICFGCGRKGPIGVLAEQVGV